MGHLCSKSVSDVNHDTGISGGSHTRSSHSGASPIAYGDVYSRPEEFRQSYSVSVTGSPFSSPLPAGIAPSPARTPGRKFRWPLPPPSPAKPIMAILRRKSRKASTSIPEENRIGEEGVGEIQLDKSFGYSKNFGAKFELGKEIGRGHFGHTFWARGKKGDLKGKPVAVKIISKSKMTSAVGIEDVRREVKILKALSGHKNLVQFHDAFEDANNIYMVMELCEGGELLERIVSRGGRYPEQESKTILVQILNVVAFFHLQGVVHRDLKPENFLFVKKDENTGLKVIDFGLSDFIKPVGIKQTLGGVIISSHISWRGNETFFIRLVSELETGGVPVRTPSPEWGCCADEHLNDVVGSAYYVAPEVLYRSYSHEADVWSIGVIAYILLCGGRPFWARTESGIFRSVLRADPNFDDSPWPTISAEAKDFVKRLLNKDHRKRMTAVQALTHPWLRDENIAVPLDSFIYKSVKAYLRVTPFKRAALKALAKALTEDELFYLRAQFKLLEPQNGFVTIDNFKEALVRNATDAMRESNVLDILKMTESVAYERMDFEEFCAAAISVYQLEAVAGWEGIATRAFEYFEQDGNRVISVHELVQEMNLSPAAHSFLQNWTRSSDGKLSFFGYTRFLHGVTLLNTVKEWPCQQKKRGCNMYCMFPTAHMLLGSSEGLIPIEESRTSLVLGQQEQPNSPWECPACSGDGSEANEDESSAAEGADASSEEQNRSKQNRTDDRRKKLTASERKWPRIGRRNGESKEVEGGIRERRWDIAHLILRLLNIRSTEN
ncbi:CDPK-related kinase 4, partial [Cucurbita argyrosperma subsp. argyrosperma]